MEFAPELRTLESFEQLCDLLADGVETERSPESGIVLVVDSEGNKERYFKEFNVTREDKEEINRRIINLMARGRNRDRMSVLGQQFYRQEASDLFRCIRAYAHSLPKMAEDSFDGFCDDCLKPARIEVGDGETIVHCNNCHKSLFEP